LFESSPNNSQRKWTLFDRQVWDLFISPGEVVEVRIPKARGKAQVWGGDYARGTISGYFDDHQALCAALEGLPPGCGAGVYFTLQVIDPRLIGRSFNRLRPSDLTTSDQNVITYRWLPIDIDPVRPAGISSSDAELRVALDLRDEVAECMHEQGDFGQPIKAMSGNGGHLLYRLPDLPAQDKTNQAFVKGFLEDLARRFGSERVKIDTTVFNPARIWKLYGTKASKGDEIPQGPNREARPHRVAFIEELPEQLS
jgi:hypothetical protein